MKLGENRRPGPHSGRGQPRTRPASPGRPDVPPTTGSSAGPRPMRAGASFKPRRH